MEIVRYLSEPVIQPRWIPISIGIPRGHPPTGPDPDRAGCRSLFLFNSIYLCIINNCAGSPEFYFWLRRYLRAGYCAGARVYALSRSISSVFRDDTLDTTDTVVAALAEVDPSELARPFPDLDDPDNPFWEQESEDCHKWPYHGHVEFSSPCILEAIRNYRPS